MFINNLMIEVTRKCNMKCAHCLRGPAQCLSLKKNIIPNIFHDITYIDSIQFTGGEPMLALYQMREIIKYILENDIEIGSFWFKTNGTIFSEAILKHFEKLFNIAGVAELCVIDFSFDQFHDKKKMKALDQFFYMEDIYPFIKISENSNSDFKNIDSVIKEGRAKRLPQYKIREFRKPYYYSGWYPEDHENYPENFVYVSSNGNVISECNLSYSNIDKFSFGNVVNEYLVDIVKRKTTPNVQQIFF